MIVSMEMGVTIGPRVFVLLVASWLLHSALGDPQTGVFAGTGDDKASNDTETFLGPLADSKVIGGAVLVQKSGKVVYAKGFGSASEELGVPLKEDHIFPIGSNTKFFTAVAIYQLQEKGLLNLTDAVNSYIEPTDFGLALPWCPKIHDKEQLGCQEPTIKQLLMMSSGLLPVDNLGCGTPNSTWSNSDWFWEYRSFDWDFKWGDAMGYTGPWLSGNATHADLLKFQKTFDQPLLYAPGSQYCYVNANFQIAGYIVEKVTNVTFGSYLTDNIIKPANLSNTYYWTGAPGCEPEGLHRRVVTVPGYKATFEGGSGPAAFKKINRQPWFPGQSSTAAQAAGSLNSNTHDLLRFYSVVLGQPETLGLSKEAVANLTEPLQPIAGSNASFAQGTAVVNSTSKAKQLAYTGEIWGFEAQITVWVNPKNASESDAVLFFSNVSPVIPFGADGSCSVLSAQNGSRINLDRRACGNTNGAGMTSIVTDRLAEIWGITGDFASV